MSTTSQSVFATLPDGLIPGFERRRLPGDGVTIDTLVGGSGPPLLLLHGYPQTRVLWKLIAPRLADRFTVVVPDLRGYGRSDKPEGDASHLTYSKRAMALDQIAIMRALGFDRFALAGHDRGGRVGYRLALDYPDVVSALAVLDIVPTADVWAGATAEAAMRMYHWYFLARPRPLPETLIGGDPEFYLRHTLASWAAPGFVFDAENLADYVACFCRPDAIHAACEDYRSGWSVDREHDEADRGSKLIKAPLLTIWSEGFGLAPSQPQKKWGEWAERVEGHAVAGGHFVCEEQPEQVGASLLRFFEPHAKS